MSTDEFKVVHYKKGRKCPKNKYISHYDRKEFDPIDTSHKDAVIRRIEQAKEEILISDFYSSVRASFREGLTLLENPSVEEIVCFGLGPIGELVIPKYQLALLLCLKDIYHANVSVFDPIFSPLDIWVLDHYGLGVLDKNTEGKHKVNGKTTIFYMPHCPHELTNNLLWANWGLELNRCIIFANSFNHILEHIPKESQLDAEFIAKVVPHIVELAVINSFKLYEVFNDMGIHIFPWDKIRLITDDFWNLNTEPTYIKEELDLITSSVNCLRLSHN